MRLIVTPGLVFTLFMLMHMSVYLLLRFVVGSDYGVFFLILFWGLASIFGVNRLHASIKHTADHAIIYKVYLFLSYLFMLVSFFGIAVMFYLMINFEYK